MSDDTADEGFAVYHLTDLIDRLSALLEEETSLINAGQLHAITALLPEKQALTAAVEQGSGIIQRPGGPPGHFDPHFEDDMADLRDAVQYFYTAAHHNDCALKASLRATDRVIRAVVTSAARIRTQEAMLYTAEGVVRSTGMRGRANKALNHSL